MRFLGSDDFYGDFMGFYGDFMVICMAAWLGLPTWLLVINGG